MFPLSLKSTVEPLLGGPCFLLFELPRIVSNLGGDRPRSRRLAYRRSALRV
jgi:hypothetical protein